MPCSERSPFRLDGRTAWVTGSSRGLGKSIAQRLAAAGAYVVVNARFPSQEAEDVGTSIRSRGGSCVCVYGDVTNEEAMITMAAEIETTCKSVDILVVNATPVQRGGQIEHTTWTQYAEYLDAFLKSPIILTRRFLPSMRAQRFGRIINITSEALYSGEASSAAYVAAKAAQVAFLRSAAQEFASAGITVNAVAPGWIPVERHASDPPKAKEYYLSTIPIGRWGTPDDVAGAVHYLASDESSFVTGQTLIVNGGRAN